MKHYLPEALIHTKIYPAEYKLIYRYNGDPSLSTEMTFTGAEIFCGLNYLEYAMQNNNASYGLVKQAALLSVLDWGRMKTCNISLAGTSRQHKRFLSKAIKGHKRCLEDLRQSVCACLAAHVDTLTRTHSLIVDDLQPGHEELMRIKSLSQEELIKELPDMESEARKEFVASLDTVGCCKVYAPVMTCV